MWLKLVRSKNGIHFVETQFTFRLHRPSNIVELRPWWCRQLGKSVVVYLFGSSWESMNFFSACQRIPMLRTSENGPCWGEQLIFSCVISQNGQTHFKNLEQNAAKFLKCVWSFWDIMIKGLSYFQWMIHLQEEFIRFLYRYITFFWKTY